MGNLIHPQDYVDMDVAPAIEAKVEATLARLAESSRRSFLGRGLAVAGAGAALGLGSTARAATTTTTTMTTTTTGSGSAATTTGSTTAVQTNGYVHQVLFDESNHVNIVVSAIRLLGGTPRPYPTFTAALKATSRADFFLKAATFENTGVGAYFGGSPYIFNPAILAVATSLALVEGYHAGFLNSVNQGSLVPGGLPYAQALTPAQVVTINMPFIASLNDNGAFPPTYSTTPSASNDIAILNFALIQELLETTFYSMNVPALF